jgi:hypothetical protein
MDDVIEDWHRQARQKRDGKITRVRIKQLF